MNVLDLIDIFSGLCTILGPAMLIWRGFQVKDAHRQGALAWVTAADNTAMLTRARAQAFAWREAMPIVRLFVVDAALSFGISGFFLLIGGVKSAGFGMALAFAVSVTIELRRRRGPRALSQTALERARARLA